MPFGLFLPPPEKPEYAEVRFEKSREEPLLVQAKEQSKLNEGSAVEGMPINNHGQIKSMSMPSGWTEQSSTSSSGGGIGSRSFRVFNPQDNKDVEITLFYRGLPISEDAGNNFKKILHEPAHKLSKEELEQLDDVLSELGNPAVVDLFSVATEDLNGKRVLRIAGEYKKKQNRFDEIFIDADGSGRAIQEIYYLAPKDVYQRYEKQAFQAFTSINWR